MTPIPRIQDSFPSASHTDITKFEKQFKLQIPLSYRNFLMTTNGGSFPVDVCFGPYKAELGIRLFYSLNATFDYLDLGARRKVYSWKLPKSMLVIADDGLGNPICINLKSPSAEVCLYNHEQGDIESVCTDFEQFLAGLHYPLDPAIQLWSETVEPFLSIEQGNMSRVSQISFDETALTNEDGYTLLGWAAASRQPEVVEFLLDLGADIQDGAGDAMTPLMLASRAGALDVVRILLDRGAKLDEKDSVGKTALLHALSSRQTRAARYLIERGADTRVQDKNGNSPIDYCEDGSARTYILPLL
ncbi:hypothetical protein DTL42_16870 [Bremerella cremea]|uniref:Knr4/Smi1-like domain-containing protein n=1 Tax=Bremerella cremea TaxID=1031537 RepID=A0A368KMY4_9BACT|nr:ankyrin repeat domain-containing protein [Bremerella cremea]RCS44598.1 hypothetical protein DTL42_16870 [Bremerella cremea]